MSLQNLQTFRQKISTDTGLQSVIRKSLETGNISEIVELGKTHGFEFSKTDLRTVFVDGSHEELSEFELELVAGGAATYPTLNKEC